MDRILIRDAQIVNPGGVGLMEGDLLLEDGRIAQAAPTGELFPRGEAVPAGIRVIDGRDRIVFPGLIDAHMHMDFWDWHTTRARNRHRGLSSLSVPIVAALSRRGQSMC